MVKMTSFEVIHTTRTESDECTDSAEFSFLPIPPSTEPEDCSFNMTNLQSALMTATPDLTMDEVHHRLMEMLQENEELKDALKKNNVMMQEQLSIVSSWHEQMLQAKKKQQAELQQAKEKTSVLEEENTLLTSKIKDLENKIESSMKFEACSSCRCSEVLPSDEKDNLVQDKSSSREDSLMSELQKQKKFQKELQSNIIGISHYLEHLQNNSKLLADEKRELTALNNDLQVRLSIMNSCEPVIISGEESGYAVVSHPSQLKSDALKDTLLQLHEHEEKLLDLTKQLEEKDMEIASLSKKASDQEIKIKQYEKIQMEQEEAIKAKFEVSQNRLEMATSLADKYKDRCDSLQQHMEDYQLKLEQVQTSDFHVIEQLKEEVKNLQDVLKYEQTAKEEDKKKLLDVENSFALLSNDFKRVNNLLEIQAQEQKEKRKLSESSKEVEVKNYLEQIDALTAKLMDAEQQVENKQERIDVLCGEVSTLKEDSETIPILKAQVEVYKIDFNNEKTAKESAQKMVQDLEERIKILEENASSSAQGGAASHVPLSRQPKPGRKRSNPEEQQAPIACPLCQIEFHDLKSAQSHVDRCGDSMITHPFL